MELVSNKNGEIVLKMTRYNFSFIMNGLLQLEKEGKLTNGLAAILPEIKTMWNEAIKDSELFHSSRIVGKENEMRSRERK